MESEKRFATTLRAVINDVRIGLVALAADGTITEANAAAEMILGDGSTQIVGESLDTLVDADDRSRLREALLGASEKSEGQIDVRIGGDTWRVGLQTIPRTVSGAIVAVLSYASAGQSVVDKPDPALARHLMRFHQAAVALDPESRVIFANQAARSLVGDDAVRVGAAFDVPELHALAERLVRVDAPLRPRLVETGNRALRVSGLSATDNDPAVLFVEDVSSDVQHERVMREFLRNAAHQLRTPLAGITAAIETLQAGAKNTPADRERFLGHIQTHTERLSQITRGLLLLARSESGDVLALDTVRLAPLLEELVADTRQPPAVSIRVSCEPELAVLASPDLLREALEVLIDNGVSHTAGGIIHVSASRVGTGVRIAVADSGEGIPEEFLERIFEPFFRVAPAGGGYGLGLAIAASAVRAMRGEIEVSSKPGEGTTFTLSLRAAPTKQ